MTRRDVFVTRYPQLLLRRPGILFAFVPPSSSELSEPLPCDNLEFYGHYSFIINLNILFCFCCVFFSGVMEECVLGSGHTVLYWDLCYSDTTWTHSF